MITKEEAIRAIKRLCMYDGETPQMIWSTDAMDAVRKIPESSAWIRCEDELPDEPGEYIVCNRGKVMTAVFYDDWVVPYRNTMITHWMPMPDAPEEEA